MEVIRVEDIGLCRSGPDNDIDLEAVYGGRFSGKKEKDLKINPVYSEVNNVNQLSDINGNMSPVHVVTYESFPRSRKNTVPSENGSIQNGEVINTIKSNLESDNNNENDKQVIVNCKRNNVTNGETNSLKLSEEIDNYKPSTITNNKTYEKTSDELVNGNGDHQTDTDVKHPTADNSGEQATSDQEVQTRAYFKDYGLLGYTNGSFVLDETHLIIETKVEPQVESPKHTVSSNEIHANSTQLTNQSETNGEPLENSSANCVDPKSVSKEQTTVIISKQISQLQSVDVSDLPESTYQEILDLCDLKTPISEGLCTPCDLSVSASEDLPNPCESPQICHTEIVTEVLVHNSAINETPKMHYKGNYSENDHTCHSFENDRIPDISFSQTEKLDNDSEWPDIDELVRGVTEDDNVKSTSVEIVTEIAQIKGNETDSPGHVRSISDIILQENDGNINSNSKSENLYDGQNSEASSLYKKRKKKSNSCSKSCGGSEVGSSTRTLKSILSNSSSHYSYPPESEHKRQNSDLEIHELKSVKFSEDTVFNENKSNKYKKEKFGHINLRELYRGKIMSDNAIAKMNPLYQPEDNVVEDGDHTDNEQLTYQLTLRNALRLSKTQKGSLNSPSYLEQYLILKAHGMKKENIDIEKLPETMEKPVYDRLIQRTLAKERRKFCMKWSMVILTVAIITAIATTLGVYFKQNF